MSNQEPLKKEIEPIISNGNGDNHRIKRHKLFNKVRKRLWFLNSALFVILLIFSTVIFYLMQLYISQRLLTPKDYIKHPLVIDIKTHYELSLDMGLEISKIENVQVTAYCNRVEECDSTPDLTSTGRIVFEGSIAVSQDLLKNRTVRYGDIVFVEKLNKYFVVEDTMNIRHTKAVDIFYFKRFLKEVDKFGLQRSNIYVIRVSK